MFKTALIFLLCTFSAIASDIQKEGAKVGQWTQDYDAAMKLASAKKLPLLLNFTGSDWCHWCIHMDKKVFSDKAFKNYAGKNLVLVHLDFPNDKSRVPEAFRERNAKLQEEFGVRGYPTFFVIETKDAKSYSILGKLGASEDIDGESFNAQIDELIRFSDNSLNKFKATLKADEKKEFNKILATQKAALDKLNKWLEGKPQRNEANTKLYQEMSKEISTASAHVKNFVNSRSKTK